MTEENKNYNIIIVDDDEFLVDMYSVKFGHMGVKVEHCKTGAMLLEKLHSNSKIDLLLLDIVMPGMNGLEILRQIRQEKLIENVPVVMLTNQNDEKNINDAKDLGISGYIVKAAATPSEVVAETMAILKNTSRVNH